MKKRKKRKKRSKGEIRIGTFLSRIARIEGADRGGMVERVSGTDPFMVLVSTILSLRTKDELTEVKAADLWLHASTPEGMIRLGADRISAIVYPVGFYRRKGLQIVEISRIVIERHGGRVPDTIEELVALPGVGRKTANLVLVAGHGKPGVCVDTHVHRITNRWGYVRTRSPDETEQALRARLPRKHWMEVNGLLVFFGKSVCQPVSPWCSRCPLASECPRIGVARSR